MGKYLINEAVKITKLVNGGQGLGSLRDGRYVFVWNSLPNELVRVRLIKNKKSYAEGIAEEIIVASPLRIKALDNEFLATSPWQIIDSKGEEEAKIGIVKELFSGQKLNYLTEGIEFIKSTKQWHYRNKMEYSFWGDDNGLHLALHQRGSSNKQIVSGSSLAMAEVDNAAKDILKVLEVINIRATKLKTIVVRSSQAGQISASLFVTGGEFANLSLPPSIKGLKIYFSNPKSPASVPSKLLNSFGDPTIEDYLLEQSFSYDADAFFQVNVPIYIKTLEIMRALPIKDSLVDMYCGVGSIGLSLPSKKSLQLVELNPASASFARVNVKKAHKKAEIIIAPAEEVIKTLSGQGTIIFDPPRAGLHPKIIKALLDTKPEQIFYLSCNPATLVRDIALLATAYSVKPLKLFNYFPKTPHIETLAILELKASQ